MSDPNNGFTTLNIPTSNISWALGPREFVFKYIKYLPWLIICVVVAFVLAYIRIRYTTRIYHVQSSMMIKEERASAGDNQRFDELFMNSGGVNLNDEIQILHSRPVMQRVAKDLGIQIRYFGTGKIIRSSLSYPDAPVKLEILGIADSSNGFGFQVNVLNDNLFNFGKGTKTMYFGQPFDLDRNRVVLYRNKLNDIHNYSSPQFLVRWDPIASAADGLIGGLKIVQADPQSTILTLSYETENISLGKDVLNTLMAVYDSLIVEDKKQINNNTLTFINLRLKELSDQLNGEENNIKDYRVKNEVFDIEGQSKMYLGNIEETSKQSAQQQVKIRVLNWLLDYLKNPSTRDSLVPVNVGIEEPVLGQLVAEYNRLQQEKESNLKTTPANNPMIIAMESRLEKLRIQMVQVLINVREGYQISLDKMDQQAEGFQGQLRALPGKTMQLVNIQRRQKILEDLYSIP